MDGQLTLLPGLVQLEYFANIYPTYMSNLENAKTIEREMRKRNSVFASFLEVSVRRTAGEMQE